MVRGPIITELDALKNLPFTTVRIATLDETDSVNGFGTGFFFYFPFQEDPYDVALLPYLITNKHVIKDSKKAKLVFHLGQVQNNLPTGEVYPLIIDDFESQFILHPNPHIDLCTIPMSKYFQDVKSRTEKYVYYEVLDCTRTS